MTGKIKRRLFHLGAGSIFPISAFFLAPEILLILVATATFLFLLGEWVRFLFPRINRWLVFHLGGLLKEQEAFRLTGSTYLIIASFVVFLLFDKYVAILALLFLALGDPLAATVGERFGRRRVFNKSLEGSGAFLLSSLAMGLLLSQGPLSLSAFAVLVGGVSAAATELLPLPIDDNLTIPLVGGGAMTLASL